MTTTFAPGFSWASRRMACRLLASPSWVTVQVLTTHSDAGSPEGASAKPACSSNSLTYWVSYWLTLQPRVTRRTVADIGTSDVIIEEEGRPRINTDQHG